MTCHSAETIYLASYQRNMSGVSCSFCYCEENPLLRLAGCGDLACTTCFQAFAFLEVGSKRLKYDPQTEHYTLSCPIHEHHLIRYKKAKKNVIFVESVWMELLAM
jgi:hypothetical protein